MVSKVDRLSTVEVSKKKIATVATSRQSIFRRFCCGFFIGFQWENGRIRTNGLKIFKSFRRSQQSATWLIVIVATVYVIFETDQLSTPKKKSNDCRQLVNFQKKIPQQSIYRQKSTVDFKAWRG
jgi:hypothetical protein